MSLSSWRKIILLTGSRLDMHRLSIEGSLAIGHTGCLGGNGGSDSEGDFTDTFHSCWILNVNVLPVLQVF